MNRLQKKCLVAAASMHFLVVVTLLCSGFITSKPKVDDSQVLEVFPSKAIDVAMQSGVRSAQPPPPTPLPPPPEPPTPAPPEPPQPVVKNTEPPKTVEPVKLPEPIAPEVIKPEVHAQPKPPKPQHIIDVDLKPVVREKTAEADRREAEAKAKAAQEAERKAQQAAEREAKRERDTRIRTFENAARAIKEGVKPTTTVELMPGNNSVAYANYASIVKSVYTLKWILPDNAANDEANVKVSVTIARDGQVLDARIVERSGDSSVDASVQRTLDRVRDIAPFPDDATDKERTYIINFNLKAKRMLG